MSINSIGYDGSRATERGTKISKPGSDMDKNAFLKILSAQLSNQDPMSNTDSTQYISQMAQFTAMEQMQNLNSTMTKFADNSLVGKGVTTKVLDDKGIPYTGIVKAVTDNSGKITISLEVNNNGKNELKDFDKNDISSVLNVPDYSLNGINNINGNMQFLLASSFIDKKVTINEKDGNGNLLKGEVISAFKDNGLIKVTVKLDGENISKDYTLDKITKISK